MNWNTHLPNGIRGPTSPQTPDPSQPSLPVDNPPSRSPLADRRHANPLPINTRLSATSTQGPQTPPSARSSTLDKLKTFATLHRPSKTASRPGTPGSGESSPTVGNSARSTFSSLESLSIPRFNASSPKEQTPGPDLSRLTGHSTIGSLLSSPDPTDQALAKQIFAEGFTSRSSLRTFMGQHIAHSSVQTQLSMPAEKWTPQNFQALFMASWLQRPTEKGSYMVPLTPTQFTEIQKACKQKLPTRPSSHFGGTGFSAAEGYAFLNGYKELLVQTEVIDGKHYLFLKTEGHTTKGLDAIKHAASLVSKWTTGAGVTASKALNQAATAAPDLITQRAAENFGKGYGRLLAEFGVKGKKTTARELMTALLTRIEERRSDGDPKAMAEALAQASNGELGERLLHYCQQVDKGNTRLSHLGNGFVVDEKMLADLRHVAGGLLGDGDSSHPRVYGETIAAAGDIDTALGSFGLRPAIQGNLLRRNASASLGGLRPGR